MRGGFFWMFIVPAYSGSGPFCPSEHKDERTGKKFQMIRTSVCNSKSVGCASAPTRRPALIPFMQGARRISVCDLYRITCTRCSQIAGNAFGCRRLLLNYFSLMPRFVEGTQALGALIRAAHRRIWLGALSSQSKIILQETHRLLPRTFVVRMI